MWVIQYAIFGLVAGAIARLLHPGHDPMSWIWTMVLGIGGAVVGGWIGGQLGINTNSGVASWVAAISGAVLLLAAYHAAHRPTRSSGRARLERGLQEGRLRRPLPRTEGLKGRHGSRSVSGAREEEGT